jgi:acetyl-CoA carboxylase biotin carboxylase subunit
LFKKILVANRGEIALRIIRTCKELGIKTVIPYSNVDRLSIPVACAEESYPLDGDEAKDTYLNIEKIIKIAKDSGAEAIHPGYGFLSENYLLAKACKESGIVFIGPKPEIIAKMGDKISAKKIAKEAGIPVVRGVNRPIKSLHRAKWIASIIGYPVIIKAVNGGGGKGMRVVTEEKSLEMALKSASREAATSFSSEDVFIEKFIDNPRHVEVQILADNYGNTIHLYERDCTIQRRHQKLFEEAPCPVLTRKKRERLGELAIKACKAMKYNNAGTVEFLLDGHGHFYFMEINARIQVEHPVTELITGVDLVKEQIKIAAGEKLSYKQHHIKINGHAMECRINAEDSEADFVPSTGTITEMILPGGNGIRVDTALKQGQEITLYYDSMLAKILAHAKDRNSAITKMSVALTEMKITGVKTTITFFRKLLMDKGFLHSNYTTKFLETFRTGEKTEGVHFDAAAIFAALFYKKNKTSKAYTDTTTGPTRNSKWGQAGRSEAIRVRRGW